MIKQLVRQIILGGIWVYKTAFSWLLPPCCRFTPSCSAYAREAVIIYGPWRGTWLAVCRLCRCQPFYRGSVFDPVPLKQEDQAAVSTRQKV